MGHPTPVSSADSGARSAAATSARPPPAPWSWGGPPTGTGETPRWPDPRSIRFQNPSGPLRFLNGWRDRQDLVAGTGWGQSDAVFSCRQSTTRNSGSTTDPEISAGRAADMKIGSRLLRDLNSDPRRWTMLPKLLLPLGCDGLPRLESRSAHRQPGGNPCLDPSAADRSSQIAGTSQCCPSPMSSRNS